MAGGPQVLQGLNHNVKHRGKGYHVQTEDLGLANPHVVTHVFAGGNVVATTRTSYAGLAAGAEGREAVRRLMERQHTDVVRELLSGKYDARDDALAATARAWQPGEIAAGPPPASGAPPASTMPRPPPPPSPPVLARAAAAASPARPAPVAVGAAGGASAPAEHDASLEQALLAYLAGDHDDLEP